VHQLGYDDVVDEYHVVRAPLPTLERHRRLFSPSLFPR
jgi:hypothetical protein